MLSERTYSKGSPVLDADDPGVDVECGVQRCRSGSMNWAALAASNRQADTAKETQTVGSASILGRTPAHGRSESNGGQLACDRGTDEPLRLDCQLGVAPQWPSHGCTQSREVCPYAAQERGEWRGCRTEGSKVDEVERADLVQAKLCVKWSPIQFSDHLATTFPDRAEIRRVSRNDLPGAACAGRGVTFMLACPNT